MNADKILFRCSSLAFLMTEPREKAAKERGELSETTKKHLIDVFVSAKYDRFTEIKGKFLDKGNETEEDSITTVSRITKTFFKKNVTNLKNEFLSGTPDLFLGEDVHHAEIIRDTKSSWDVFTFNRAKGTELSDKYKWQGTGYMALTGANKCYIDYCLNNTPYSLVNKELYYESFNHSSSNTPAWIELQIIANHTYDKKTFDEYIATRGIDINADVNSKAVYAGFVEIPLQERHFAFEFKRNESDIEKLYNRIRACRTWMDENLFN